ncbi:MAG TPA: chemotaxis protein CheB [Planctomycetota bacterium]|nr:chemotaxis protein CheB [Planctomycetota bacterium]
MTRGLAVFGGSAGAVPALQAVVSGLPAAFPAAVCVAVHVPAEAESRLPEILTRSGPLPARHARDGDALLPGVIHVAPPDRHLLIAPGEIRVVRTPRENGHRPAIDPLFRSAAFAYGRHVAAVLLSGALDDGVAGLATVKKRRGLVVVQDPSEAVHGDMPKSAMDQLAVDHVLPAAAIAELLRRVAGGLVEKEAGRRRTAPAGVASGPTPEEGRDAASGLTCPDCGGALWADASAGRVRFACHVGHAFSTDSLASRQRDAVESAIWHAVVLLRERSELLKRLADSAGGGRGAAATYGERASRFAESAAVLEHALRTSRADVVEDRPRARGRDRSPASSRPRTARAAGASGASRKRAGATRKRRR